MTEGHGPSRGSGEPVETLFPVTGVDRGPRQSERTTGRTHPRPHTQVNMDGGTSVGPTRGLSNGTSEVTVGTRHPTPSVDYALGQGETRTTRHGNHLPSLPGLLVRPTLLRLEPGPLVATGAFDWHVWGQGGPQAHVSRLVGPNRGCEGSTPDHRSGVGCGGATLRTSPGWVSGDGGRVGTEDRGSGVREGGGPKTGNPGWDPCDNPQTLDEVRCPRVQGRVTPRQGA